MTPNINSLSVSKLKQLSDKKGGTCTVMYTPVAGGEKQILLEGYSKPVGMAFSKLFSDQFPPINKVKIADLKKPYSNQVLVVGGRIEAHKLILNWMFSCCTGAGMQKFPTFETKKFTRYYLVKDAAQILQAPHVVELMTARMDKIAAIQVHSEDVRAMYVMLGREHPLVQEIAQKTALLMSKGPKNMKAYNVYTTLAQELKEFGEDIAPVLNAAKAVRDEEHQDIRFADRDHQHTAWNLQKKAAYAARKNAGPHATRATHASPTSEGSMVKHKVIRAEKRGNGRLVLPLAELGVGAKQNFLTPLYIAPYRPHAKNSGSNNEGKSVTDPVAKSSSETGRRSDSSQRSTEADSVTNLSVATTLVDFTTAAVVKTTDVSNHLEKNEVAA